LDFKAGDIFTEMFSHYKQIVAISEGMLIVFEGHPARPKQIKLNTYTPEDFRTKCAYGRGTSGYWLDYIGNENDEGKKGRICTNVWIEQFKQGESGNIERKMKILSVLSD
jgi:hypothetical protein